MAARWFVQSSCVLCIQASTLTKAHDAQEVLVTFAQVRRAGHGAKQALLGWPVIILRSQDPECQIARMERQGERAAPCLGRSLRVTLDTVSIQYQESIHWYYWCF